MIYFTYILFFFLPSLHTFVPRSCPAVNLCNITFTAFGHERVGVYSHLHACVFLLSIYHYEANIQSRVWYIHRFQKLSKPEMSFT
jgi:hypothetical protein